MRTRRAPALVAAVAAAIVITSACASGAQPTAATTDRATSSAAAPAAAQRADDGAIDRVVVISLDGLNPAAITKLGPKGAPVLHRLMRKGSSTLNARTMVEMTVTLPNHTSMVTGRRIDAADGGHGVTWNDDRQVPNTVQAAAGAPVSSIFTVVKDAGLTSALFTSKTKFSLWQRSWPLAVDRNTMLFDNRALAKAAREDIISTPHDLTFVHLSNTDSVGHAIGWMTPAYLRAVRQADRNVGRILGGIRKSGRAGETALIVTSDHGGVGRDHGNAALYADYRIPFLVKGPGIPKGTNLYALNPTYAAPRKTQPAYDAPKQPIRNGSVANLVADLLDLPAVPGSQVGAEQDLNVFAR